MQIYAVDKALSDNIDELAEKRGLLAQNMLAQLRNLVEAVAFRLQRGTGTDEFHFDQVSSSIAFVRSKSAYNFLGRFHKMLQATASHYTLDQDTSERLMLKYFEFLFKIRHLLKEACGLDVLGNLEKFPVESDPALREYHEKIAERIQAVRARPGDAPIQDTYYIHKAKPFFVGERVFYEVSFYPARNKANKADRMIAFTDVDMTDNYAGLLQLVPETIAVLDLVMPIVVIKAWQVWIRPCEFDNFARILGMPAFRRSRTSEYRHLVDYLTSTGSSLIDVIEMDGAVYSQLRADAVQSARRESIFPVLDEARKLISKSAAGSNVLRYLLLDMNNLKIKAQYRAEPCPGLSGLRLPFGAKPFDTMPYCTSLPGHNIRFADLLASIGTSNRLHELLARRVSNNVEHRGVLYTPVSELEGFGDLALLIAQYNRTIYYKHTHRTLERDKDHLFFRGYEDDTVAIIENLQSDASTGVVGYGEAVERWLNEGYITVDDEAKADALKRLFTDSRVALIYGAAGTGKSTMVNHIASYFQQRSKLFLAQTHPAVDNLHRRIASQQNATFRTIASHIHRTPSDIVYDILVIDECSTVSNSDLLQVLRKTKYRLLVLVGDVYQIGSIQFGNWFSAIRSFLPKTAVFELKTPYRTKNRGLLDLWAKVRGFADDVDEALAKGKFSSALDKSLLEHSKDDQITLCLNYDGLYGINNINRFLQSSNPNPAVEWEVARYKTGDPVLFNETERFKPLLYNNLKGRIVDVERLEGSIRFDIALERSITEFDVDGVDLQYLRGSVVRFFVHENAAADDDDDSVTSTVPFQVAYAVSIHKAQGLEYDSVRVVITDDNDDDISHSIFYTAITRAREKLRIYWSVDAQRRILGSFEPKSGGKDVALLMARRGLVRSAR
jgi:energy-coupling factor transporter ATP-binding protein EcfA2